MGDSLAGACSILIPSWELGPCEVWPVQRKYSNLEVVTGAAWSTDRVTSCRRIRTGEAFGSMASIVTQGREFE